MPFAKQGFPLQTLHISLHLATIPPGIAIVPDSLGRTLLSSSFPFPFRPRSFFVYTTIRSRPANASSKSGLCDVSGTL